MLAVALVIAASTTVGSGVSKTETRALDAFTAVSMAGDIEVDVAKGDKAGCTVTTDDNIVALVITEVKDGTLSVHLKSGLMESVRPKTPVVVKVTASQALAKLSSAGSGSLNVVDVPAEKSLDISGAGSGPITWKGGADDVKASVSGSGVVTLTGKATKLDTSIAGSGGVDAFAFEVQNANASIAGSGFSHVNAATSTTASVIGSGKVVYAGAAKVTKSITGSGSVEPKDKPTKAASGW